MQRINFMAKHQENPKPVALNYSGDKAIMTVLFPVFPM